MGDLAVVCCERGCLKHGRLFNWRTSKWTAVSKDQLIALRQIFEHLGIDVVIQEIPCDVCRGEAAGRVCSQCTKPIVGNSYVMDDEVLFHIKCWTDAFAQFLVAQQKILDALSELQKR